jgi:hypothetical protein
MKTTLVDRLRSVEVLAPQGVGALQVFGLRWNVNAGLSYWTLDEGLKDGTVKVTEISDGGSVPLLKVINRGDVPIFLLAGEELIGAKQNRILNTSLLVPAATELTIPVSCVEAGRWGYRSPAFASAGTAAHGKLRKLLAEHTLASYKHHGWPTSQQGEVWQEVGRKLHAMGSVSGSSALQQAYQDHQARLRDVLGSIRVSPECAGVAFVVGDKVAGVDLFDRPTTLAKLLPKVARAYAIDALELKEEPVAPFPVDRLRHWLHGAAEGKLHSYKSPGMGFDVRLEGREVIGGILVVEEQPIHAELFAV